MKNKHIALFMAFIMCFSLLFGSAAAIEGEQIMPSTSAVAPTTGEPDMADQIGGALGDAAGDDLSQAGDEIMDGIEQGYNFLGAMQKIIETVKIFFSNLINTIFPFFNIGMGDSLFN